MSLTPRQRLALTLEHKDPGKVVVDLGATPITGINANALQALRNALGLEVRPVKMDEPLQLLGLVEEDLRQAIGVDVVGVTNGGTLFGFKNNRGWKPWVMQSGLHVEVPVGFQTTVDAMGDTFLYPAGDTSVPPSGKMPKDGYFFDNITRSNSTVDDVSDARVDFANDFAVYTDEDLRDIQSSCDEMYNNTEYGMIGGGALAGFGDFASVPGPGVKHPKGLRDLPEFIMAHNVIPEYIHDLFGMQLEVALKNAELFYQAVGDKVQVMQISGTDFGQQRGPYMSPDSYREFYKPYHIKINEWVHTHTKWKTFYHSCGSVVAFLKDFHEAGIDVLNPVQTSAAGMDPKWLKQQWGDQFVFWGGGIDTQKTLPFGTPEEVYEEAMERLRIFAPGGGYVFNPIHNIQGQTSAENLLALFEAVKDYNRQQ